MTLLSFVIELQVSSDEKRKSLFYNEYIIDIYRQEGRKNEYKNQRVRKFFLLELWREN